MPASDGPENPKQGGRPCSEFGSVPGVRVSYGSTESLAPDRGIVVIDHDDRYPALPFSKAMPRTGFAGRWSPRRFALEEAAMDLVFEWDEGKGRRNETKHGVTFAEGQTVFNDPFAVTITDPDHSEYEDRWLDIGLSSKGRLVTVWYTEREERIRIIGCRKATPAEQRYYKDERIR